MANTKLCWKCWGKGVVPYLTGTLYLADQNCWICKGTGRVLEESDE